MKNINGNELHWEGHLFDFDNVENWKNKWFQEKINTVLKLQERKITDTNQLSDIW